MNKIKTAIWDFLVAVGEYRAAQAKNKLSHWY